MNDEPFDSTHLRNKTFEFKLGAHQVVIGLDVAVATMKKHEKSQFIFAPEYYCGKYGCEPRVPRDTPGMHTLLNTTSRYVYFICILFHIFWKQSCSRSRSSRSLRRTLTTSTRSRAKSSARRSLSRRWCRFATASARFVSCSVSMYRWTNGVKHIDCSNCRCFSSLATTTIGDWITARRPRSTARPSICWTTRAWIRKRMRSSGRASCSSSTWTCRRFA